MQVWPIWSAWSGIERGRGRTKGISGFIDWWYIHLKRLKQFFQKLATT